MTRYIPLLLLLASPVSAGPPPFYPLPVPSYYTGPIHPFGCCYPSGSFIYGRCPWLPAYDPAIEAQRHLRRGLLMMQSYQLDDAVFAFRDSLRQKADLAVTHFWLGHVLQDLDRPADAIEEYRDALKWNFYEPAVAHNNLGTALGELGRWTDAVDEYRRALKLDPRFEKAKENLALAEPRAVLSRKLQAIVAGEAKPQSPGERIGLAEVTHARGLYATATRFWDEAFSADRTLVKPHRYHAAGSAARAGTGQGSEATDTTEAQRKRWRQSALIWLKEELAGLEAALKAGDVEAVRQRLFHWNNNADFKLLKSFEGLFALPESESQQWRKLWNDADQLLHRVGFLASGRWRIADKQLIQNEEAKPPHVAALYLGNSDWRDYTFEVEVQAAGEVGLCLRVGDPGSQVVVRLGKTGVEVYAQKGGMPLLLLGRDDTLSLTPKRWHKVKAQVVGDRYRLWIDDRQMARFIVDGFPRGRVGLRTEGGTARFRNLRVVELLGDVLFEGLPRLP